MKTSGPTYRLTINHKPSYLHAVITGVNNEQNVRHYLQDILRECKARNCRKVLIEERLDGPRLGISSVFGIASEESLQALGYFTAVAYVDANIGDNDLMKFAETVARNRALPAKVFFSVGDAEKWLTGMPGEC